MTIGNRTLHKKDVAEVPDNLLEELFQQSKAKPKNVSKNVEETVFKKNGRFVKQNTRCDSILSRHSERRKD